MHEKSEGLKSKNETGNIGLMNGEIKMKNLLIGIMALISFPAFAEEMTKGPVFVGTGEPCAIQVGDGYEEAKPITKHCAEGNAMADGLTQCQASCEVCALLKYSSTSTDLHSHKYWTSVVSTGSAVFQGYNCH